MEDNMEEKRQKRQKRGKISVRVVIAAAVLIVLAAAALLFYNLSRPAGKTGEKNVEISVIFKDESRKDYTYQTDEEYLAQLLLKEGLAEGVQGEFGLFITTVDGVEADDAKREWWCITKDGEMTETGAESIPLADGDHYELTLSTY